MFKLFSLLLTSLAVGSVLASPAPAPQDYPSSSCISCPILFIPACSILCPQPGDTCDIIPSAIQGAMLGGKERKNSVRCTAKMLKYTPPEVLSPACTRQFQPLNKMYLGKFNNRKSEKNVDTFLESGLGKSEKNVDTFLESGLGRKMLTQAKAPPPIQGGTRSQSDRRVQATS
ncbi:hypothetical protein K438DRAFT_1750319 [Mycena galopus ATCC 62051]|nr:hypothetical protein K438DRAFT_1750319 [Mycena galopus ATCC 62051]